MCRKGIAVFVGLLTLVTHMSGKSELGRNVDVVPFGLDMMSLVNTMADGW